MRESCRRGRKKGLAAAGELKLPRPRKEKRTAAGGANEPSPPGFALPAAAKKKCPRRETCSGAAGRGKGKKSSPTSKHRRRRAGRGEKADGRPPAAVRPPTVDRRGGKKHPWRKALVGQGWPHRGKKKKRAPRRLKRLCLLGRRKKKDISAQPLRSDRRTQEKKKKNNDSFRLPRMNKERDFALFPFRPRETRGWIRTLGPVGSLGSFFPPPHSRVPTKHQIKTKEKKKSGGTKNFESAASHRGRGPHCVLRLQKSGPSFGCARLEGEGTQRPLSFLLL